MNSPELKYNVLKIIRGTTVDGPGFRTSIYLAGCEHRCPGCHNPGSWDENGGIRMSLEEIMDVVREENFNVTLSGGDPLLHPEETEILINTISGAGYSVWVFTGFTWEEICADEKLRRAVRNVDTVVEGRFVEALRDPSLKFRGSSNQRFIRPSEVGRTDIAE